MASTLPQDEWKYVATAAVSSNEVASVIDDLRLLSEQLYTWTDPVDGKAAGSRPSGSSRGDSSCDDRLGFVERDKDAGS